MREREKWFADLLMVLWRCRLIVVQLCRALPVFRLSIGNFPCVLWSLNVCTRCVLDKVGLRHDTDDGPEDAEDVVKEERRHAEHRSWSRGRNRKWRRGFGMNHLFCRDIDY